MRRLIVLALAVASSPACTEHDPPPLFVDVDYQVRCIDCQPLAPDDAARSVQALDGEAGFRVECNVARREGDRLVTFTAAHGDEESPRNNYSFGMLQANLDSSNRGSGCRVVVAEGNNTYEGRCTSGDPDSDQPCRVELEVEDGIVLGTVLCEGVPNKNTAMFTRHVVAPNSQSAARFEVHGCRGL